MYVPPLGHTQMLSDPVLRGEYDRRPGLRGVHIPVYDPEVMRKRSEAFNRQFINVRLCCPRGPASVFCCVRPLPSALMGWLFCFCPPALLLAHCCYVDVSACIPVSVCVSVCVAALQVVEEEVPKSHRVMAWLLRPRAIYLAPLVLGVTYYLTFGGKEPPKE